MTLLSPVAAIPYPALTDAPNMQTAMATMTSSLDSMVVPRYSTLAILTAAVSTPTTGQQVFLTGSNAFVYWNGTAWVASGAALISQTTLGSAVASVTLSSIPAIFTHLRVQYSIQESTGAVAWNQMQIQFNGDTGSNYEAISAFYTTATSGTLTVSQALTSSTITTAANGGMILGQSLAAGLATSTVMDISNYSSTTKKKAIQSLSIGGSSGTGAIYGQGGGGWNSTAAITSITLFPLSGHNMAAGGTISLYGMP